MKMDLESLGMKWSYYNVKVELKDEILLYNLKTGSFVFLSKENLRFKSPMILKELEEEGFIRKKNSDEIKKILDMFKKTINNPKILRIILLPNEDCNFSCLYCYETLRKIRANKFLFLNLRSFIEKYVYQKKPEIVEISWFGGEPLLSPSIIIEFTKKIRKICEEYKVKEFISDVTTNGYFLTPQLFKELVKCGIGHIQVTIDGPPYIHNKFRKLEDGRSSFEVIWNNLLGIKKMKVKNNVAITIRTNFDITFRDWMKEWIDFYLKDFGDSYNFELIFRPIFPSGKEKNNKLINFCNLRQGSESEFLAYSYLLKKTENIEKLLPYLLPTPKRVYCYGALPGCYIVGADGLVWKCTVAMNPKDAIGKIDKAGEFVLFNDKMQEWNNIISQWTIDNQCLRCKLLPVCMGGCPLSRKKGKKPCYDSILFIARAMKEIHKYCEKGGVA